MLSNNCWRPNSSFGKITLVRAAANYNRNCFINSRLRHMQCLNDPSKDRATCVDPFGSYRLDCESEYDGSNCKAGGQNSIYFIGTEIYPRKSRWIKFVLILNEANQEHERQNLTVKKYRSSNQQRERRNFTGDEWTYWRKRHPTAVAHKKTRAPHISRNGLLYRIKFAQTIACCLQEQ